MYQPRRHDLLLLTQAGLDRLAATIRVSEDPAGTRMADMFAGFRLPVIVRRHSACDQTGIGVGISFPHRENGQRLRFAAAVMPREITEVISPYAIADKHFETLAPPLSALRKIKEIGCVQPGNLGIYGASALQVVTGLRYLHAQSDLDLIIRGETIESLININSVLSALETEMGVKIDVEIVLGDSGEVKMKELLSHQKTVLVKSMTHVDVIEKQVALSLLPAI